MSGKLSFKDFLPVDKTQFLAFSRSYESMAELTSRVNEWLESEAIDLVSVETLLIPGAPLQRGTSATYVELNAGSLSIGQWHQAIRVWYRVQ